MKRILYFMLVFILAITLLGSTVAFAEEIAEDTATTDETTVDNAGVEIPETEKEVADPTFFTRLYEAFTSNKTDIFTLGGSAALFVLSLILRKDFGSASKNVVDGIARVLSKTDISNEKQDAIVGGLNEMVDGYNEIKTQSGIVQEKMLEFGEQITTIYEANCSLEKKIDDVFHVILSLMDTEITQNAEVMEVLSSVYANHHALPDGIKNFVQLKRTENAQLVQKAAVLVHNEGGTAHE